MMKKLLETNEDVDVTGDDLYLCFSYDFHKEAKDFLEKPNSSMKNAKD